jgi:hypothetical protein
VRIRIEIAACISINRVQSADILNKMGKAKLITKKPFSYKFCGKGFSSNEKCLANHQAACPETGNKKQNKVKERRNDTEVVDSTLFELFPFEGDFFSTNFNEDVFIDYNNARRENYFSELTSSCQDGKFSTLLLNINSIYNKVSEVHIILELDTFDVIVINESKLDDLVPSKSLCNKHYSIMRRDRNRYGGGVLVYVKKTYKLVSEQYSPDFELIVLKLKIKNAKHNFISAYKPPKDDIDTFVSYLENVVSTIDSNETITILGDFNINMLNEYVSVKLNGFMSSFMNFIIYFGRQRK